MSAMHLGTMRVDGERMEMRTRELEGRSHARLVCAMLGAIDLVSVRDGLPSGGVDDS